MKTLTITICLAALLASCGGGGGNAGTCYPASVCGQSTASTSSTVNAEPAPATGNAAQADAARVAAPEASAAPTK